MPCQQIPIPHVRATRPKNVKVLSDSPQLRRQSVISAQSGQKAQVLVNKGRIQKISPTVQKRMDVQKITGGTPAPAPPTVKGSNGRPMHTGGPS